MKIGIDLSMLVYAGSGVATYTFNLAKSLLKYAPDHDYRFFYSSLRRPQNFYYLEELKKMGAKIVEIPLPTSATRFIWNRHSILPVEFFIGQVDVFHSSDYLRPPLMKGTKGVTTIHDLTWKLFPQYHTERVIRHHERKLERTIKHGDTIIVDSQNTKRDLLKLYPEINEGRVHVIYLGIDDRFQPIADKKVINEVLTKYLNFKFQISNFKFLLYVGAIEPRKNLDTAIKTFAELTRDGKYSDFRFVIAGRAGWKNESVFQLVKDLDLKEKIHFIGFVSDEDLPTLYSGAEVLVYLSLYEGFGLPPLEAAACDTPSLIYNNSSLAETFPKNYHFANEGTELETLKDLIEGKKKIDLSFVSQFTWKRYIKELVGVILG